MSDSILQSNIEAIQEQLRIGLPGGPLMNIEAFEAGEDGETS